MPASMVLAPRRWLLACAAALLALAGCATLNSVTSDVSSYSHWPEDRKPSTYAFERLPSQQANAAEQDAVEAAAREALAQAGFTEAADAARADVSVQVSARLTRVDYEDPFYWHGGYWWGRGWGPWWGPSFSMNYTTPRYQREVALLIRDRASGAVLYETRAANQSLGAGDTKTLAAMFAAALKDFPHTAVNPRSITIPLGGG